LLLEAEILSKYCFKSSLQVKSPVIKAL